MTTMNTSWADAFSTEELRLMADVKKARKAGTLSRFDTATLRKAVELKGRMRQAKQDAGLRASPAWQESARQGSAQSSRFAMETMASAPIAADPASPWRAAAVNSEELSAFYQGAMPGDPADVRDRQGVVEFRRNVPEDVARGMIVRMRGLPQGGIAQGLEGGDTGGRLRTDLAIAEYADRFGSGPTGAGETFVGRLADSTIGRASQAVRAGVATGRDVAGRAVGLVMPQTGAAMREDAASAAARTEAIRSANQVRPEGTGAEVAGVAGDLTGYVATLGAMPFKAAVGVLGLGNYNDLLTEYRAELERRGDPGSGVKARLAAAAVAPIQTALDVMPAERMIARIVSADRGFGSFLKRRFLDAAYEAAASAGSDTAVQAGGLAIGAQDTFDAGRVASAAGIGAAASSALGTAIEGGAAAASIPARMAERAQQAREASDLRRAQQFAREQAGMRPEGRSPEGEQRPSREPAAGANREARAEADNGQGNEEGRQEGLLTPQGETGARRSDPEPRFSPIDDEMELAKGSMVEGPDGRRFEIGEQIGRGTFILKPTDGGRLKQLTQGQMQARGFRREEPRLTNETPAEDGFTESATPPASESTPESEPPYIPPNVAPPEIPQAKPPRKSRIKAKKPTPTEPPKESADDERGPEPTADGADLFERRHRLSKPIKGKTGAEIVGYRWMSQREEGMFRDRMVSDWTRSQISEPTGREIVHLFLVKTKDGAEVLMGVGAAKKALGVDESRLYTIAKRQEAAQKERSAQWDRSEVKMLRNAARSKADADQDYRRANDPAKMMWGTPEEHRAKADELFEKSTVLTKAGRFLRTGDADTIESLKARGWTEADANTPKIERYTSIDRDWAGRTLYVWGQDDHPQLAKGNRAKATTFKGTRMYRTMPPEYRNQLAKVPTDAKRLLEWIAARTDEIWTLEGTNGRGKTLVPRGLAEKAKAAVPDWENDVKAAEQRWAARMELIWANRAKREAAEKAKNEKARAEAWAEQIRQARTFTPEEWAAYAEKHPRDVEQLAKAIEEEAARNGEEIPSFDAEELNRIAEADQGVRGGEAGADATGNVGEGRDQGDDGAVGSRKDEKGVFGQFTEGLTGKQGSLIDTGPEPTPDAEPRPEGIRPGESIDEYERRIGKKDTPPIDYGDGDTIDGLPFAPASAQERWDSDLAALRGEALSTAMPASKGGRARRSRKPAGGTVPAGGITRPPATPNERTAARSPGTSPAEQRAYLRQIRRRGGRDASALVTLHEAMRQLSGALNLAEPRTDRKKTSRLKALGAYFLNRGSVVLNAPDNVSTFAHEIGHAMHEMLFPATRRRLEVGDSRIDLEFPPEWKKELYDLGKALYGDRKPNVGGYPTEGWAELVRKIIINPASAKKMAPTVYREAVSMMVTRYPEIWTALELFRARLKYAMAPGQPPLGMYLAKARQPAPGTRALLERIIGMAARIRNSLVAGLVDREYAATLIERDLGLRERVRFADRPSVRARMAAGKSMGHMNVLIEDGPWDLTTLEPKGPGLREIFRPVAGQWDEWTHYMVMRRVREKRAQGNAGLLSQITDEQVQAAIDAGDKIPAFVKASKQFQEFNRWLIQEYCVHYGTLSEKSAAQIVAKNLDYITFRFRPDMEGLDVSGRGRQGMADQTSGVRRFKSDSKELLDPVTAFIESMEGIIRRAQMNHAARSITDLWSKGSIGISDVSRWIEKIDAPSEAQRVAAAQYRAQVLKDLRSIGDWDQLDKQAQEALVEALEDIGGPTFFTDARPGSKQPQGIISVMVAGKRQWFKVNNPDLARMMMGMENPWVATSSALKMFTWPARMLRAGATQYNPTFILTNFLRDTGDALFTSQSRLSSGFIRTREMFKLFADRSYRREVRRMARLAGGDQSSMIGEASSSGELDLSTLFEDLDLNGLPASAPTSRRLIRMAKRAGWDLVKLRPIKHVNEVAEMANRMVEFNLIRRGRSMDPDVMAEAALASRDITVDFNRGGTWAKAITQFIAFFNVAIQGTDKLYRFTTGAMGDLVRLLRAHLGRLFGKSFDRDQLRPSPRLVRFVGVFGLAAVYSYIVSGDPGFAKIPESIRNNYFVLGPFQIPKPHTAKPFLNTAERLMMKVFGTDPTGATEPGQGDPGAMDGHLRQTLLDIMPRLSLGWPQMAIEMMSNFDVYRGRPIIPMRDQDLPDYMQGASSASDFARTIGYYTDISPANIDYLIRGFTGGLGVDAVKFGADPLLRSIDMPDQVAGPRPLGGLDRPMTPGQWPVIRAIYRDSPPIFTESLIRFREDAQRYAKIAQEVRAFERDEDPKAQARGETLRSQRERDLELHAIFSARDRVIQKLFKERMALRPGNDPDAMGKRAAEIRDEIEDVIRDAYREARALEAENRR